MSVVVYVALWAGAAVFAVATAARAWMYARTPIHLRWELYPVPHEDPEKVKHGGSYFEDKDWWTHKHRYNLAGELRVMVPEMLFLNALREHNRKLWYRSFPFHFGLYMLAGTCGLVLAAALASLASPALVAGPLGRTLQWVYALSGVAGMLLALFGALGLLHRRLTDADLKTYTTAGDIFNLLFFVAAFGVLTAGVLLRAPGDPSLVALVRGVLTFDRALQVPGLLAAGIVLCALLAAYIPLTHMAHFVGKYFTYHSVRWNDQVNLRGSTIEAKLAEYLTYRPTWSAAHVGADGTRTWADIATTNPWEGAKK
ncbi:MAG: respiratory nitrate reductase subunit gamma [Thermoanaerobaculaceae bacterium]|nr:respiratory nitrate reductase subunit gamma [Thermoanaerobaculaceae bacterium]